MLGYAMYLFFTQDCVTYAYAFWRNVQCTFTCILYGLHMYSNVDIYLCTCNHFTVFDTLLTIYTYMYIYT
jgi:hypothetical protein